MKVKLRQLVAGIGPLQDAARSEKKTPLASLTLGLLLRAMDPFVRAYDVERSKLLAQYGAPVEGQETLWKFPGVAARHKFNAALEPLLEMDVELAGIAPVPASKWAENGINWGPEALLALEWLVVLDTPTLFVVPPEAEQSSAAEPGDHTSPAAG